MFFRTFSSLKAPRSFRISFQVRRAAAADSRIPNHYGPRVETRSDGYSLRGFTLPASRYSIERRSIARLLIAHAQGWPWCFVSGDLIGKMPVFGFDLVACYRRGVNYRRQLFCSSARMTLWEKRSFPLLITHCREQQPRLLIQFPCRWHEFLQILAIIALLFD